MVNTNPLIVKKSPTKLEFVSFQQVKKLRVQTCDWSKNSAWCVNFENEFFLTNHIVALSAYNLSFFICWIETISKLVGLIFYNKRLSVDH